MSTGDVPIPAVTWNLDLRPGDPVDIFGARYLFERVDPDHVVTFRAPAGAGGADFMVHGTNGLPRKPVVAEIAQLIQDEKFIFRESELKESARAYARAQTADAQHARDQDLTCDFRTAITVRFDRAPWSKSDASLKAFMREAMNDPAIAKLSGAWHASPATVRLWLKDRGTEGCRKVADGVSMRNRMPKVRSLKHPLEIVFYWSVRATNVRGDVRSNYDRYLADIEKINAGEPLNRNYLIDPDTREGSDRAAEYPKPSKPYAPVPYNRFWRICKALRSERAFANKHTLTAAYQRFGGGGVGDRPTNSGARCWMDSTPVPKLFFVDDDTGIPIGTVTMTLLSSLKYRVLLGWHLNPGACTSNAVLKTVLSAASPKNVPQHLLEIDPGLVWLRMRPATIGFDNATETHARSVEDVLHDAYIGMDFAGAKMPRDKSPQERIIKTLLDLVFSKMPDSTYDMDLMKRHGFKPEDGQVLISLREGRRLLNLAALTYNVTSTRGLDGLQPALAWRKSLEGRRPDVLYDVDRFKASIGTVATGVMTNSGLERMNRRYTPGALAMKRIIQEFDRAYRLPVGDNSPRPKTARSDRKRPGWKVKIKINEDDIGSVQVWNPFAETPCWELFECTDPQAHGMPLWLHERCLEFAKQEAMDYLSPEGQAKVRAALFDELANVDSRAAERERQTLGRAIDDPNTRKVIAGYIHVSDEEPEVDWEPATEEPPATRHISAVGKRKDAAEPTPRQKQSQPKPPVTVARRDRRRDQDPRDAGGSHRTQPSRTPPRRPSRTSAPAAERDAGARTNTSAGSEKAATTRVRPNRLKWGDDF